MTSNGNLLNPNLVDYRVPSFNDTPEEFRTVLVENEDGPGPYGVRGMGEGGLLSVAPSVCNALERATGVRIKDLPLTPERVWRALKEAKKVISSLLELHRRPREERELYSAIIVAELPVRS